MGRYRLYRYSDNERYAASAQVVYDAAWNNMFFLNFTESHQRYWDRLISAYPQYQLCLVDTEKDYVVAVGNTVPFYVSDPENLPSTGWDWMLQKADETFDMDHNMLGGLAISVSPAYRGKGLARQIIGGMRMLFEEGTFDRLVVAVRPSAKWLQPKTDMGDYLIQQDEKGRIFDPWLRSHVAMGGKITGVCDASMVVEQPIGFWETMSGKIVNDESELLVDFGLVPVELDHGKGTGRYAEPNVWVTYTR